MRVLSVAEVREADRRCIEDLGIPGAVLMNAAGRAVFNEVHARCGQCPGPVGIVCGKGNNGGDGFVAARLALLADMQPRTILLGKASELRGDAALFCGVYRRLGGPLIEATSEDAVRDAVSDLAGCCALVDAVLGTGTQGEVRGLSRAAIEAWPAGYTVSVDVPSGLDADTGALRGCAIRADVTVTFQFRKRGLEAPGAAACTGRLETVDIGIPEVCADDAAWAALTARWADADKTR